MLTIACFCVPSDPLDATVDSFVVTMTEVRPGVFAVRIGEDAETIHLHWDQENAVSRLIETAYGGPAAPASASPRAGAR